MESRIRKSTQLEFLTAEDVASLLSISRSASYKLLASGELPVVRVGRSTRVRLMDLQVFIQKHTTGAPEYHDACVGDAAGNDGGDHE